VQVWGLWEVGNPISQSLVSFFDKAYLYWKPVWHYEIPYMELKYRIGLFGIVQKEVLLLLTCAGF